MGRACAHVYEMVRVCKGVCACVSICVCPSVCVRLYCVCIPVCLSGCVSHCPFVCLTVCPSAYLHASICAVCESLCDCECLCLCVPVWLCVVLCCDVLCCDVLCVCCVCVVCECGCFYGCVCACVNVWALHKVMKRNVEARPGVLQPQECMDVCLGVCVCLCFCVPVYMCVVCVLVYVYGACRGVLCLASMAHIVYVPVRTVSWCVCAVCGAGLRMCPPHSPRLDVHACYMQRNIAERTDAAKRCFNILMPLQILRFLNFVVMWCTSSGAPAASLHAPMTRNTNSPIAPLEVHSRSNFLYRVLH
jgi:hypothetical protein